MRIFRRKENQATSAPASPAAPDNDAARNKTCPTTHHALAKHIIALSLALWMTAMGLLTWAVAEDCLRQVEARSVDYARYRTHRSYYLDADSAGMPGAMEMQSILYLGDIYDAIDIDKLLPIVLPQRPSAYGSDDWIWGKWDLLYGFEAAESFYDQEGNVLFDSGSYLAFYYTDGANWGTQNTEALGLGYVDLELVEGGVDTFAKYISDTPSGAFAIDMFLPVLRLTGHFEGTRFQPTKIESGFYLDEDGMELRVEELCKADHQGKVEWTTRLEAPSTSDTDRPVLIYAWWPEAILTKYEPLTAQGCRFHSLTELLHADTKSSNAYPAPFTYEKKNLLESILIYRIDHEDRYGTYTYAVAVRCWPLAYAALRMIPTYLVSLALLALLVWLLLRSIRRHLTEPLERLAYSTTSGTTILPHDFWEEPQTLAAYLIHSRQVLADTKAELQQTRSALHYAEHAEEKRRQLISNLTHELKTPLAVIHSYVEGLQTGIAEDKQDHYLSVIQDETQRMDTMVLQMLDLSRLEAGKVHLTMESFSLLQLTQNVTERLAPLLEKKNLTLTYGNAQNFLVTADEARMEQVITNLMTNAIKYTDEGGQIRIHITFHQRRARFAVENTAPPLSATALDKVWDSFYRADPSRTEPGTGLGLTLVKQIIGLHQGYCQVQNVKYKVDGKMENRVEFSFTLPLS